MPLALVLDVANGWHAGHIAIQGVEMMGELMQHDAHVRPAFVIRVGDDAPGQHHGSVLPGFAISWRRATAEHRVGRPLTRLLMRDEERLWIDNDVGNVWEVIRL